MTPLRLIPWSEDFLARLADHLLERQAGAPLADTVLVFPHHRPARFLTRILARHPDAAKPMVLPTMVAVADWCVGLRRDLADTPLRQAKRLDRIGLLDQVVRELREAPPQDHTGGLAAALPAEAELFFPWGARLADLCEELLRHGLQPADLPHLEGEVLPFAAALLAQLRTIFHRYLAALEARGLTTHGLDCAWLAAHLPEVAAHLRGRRVVLAGFYALSGTEEALFHHLWRQGLAEVVWHGDPALAAASGGAHWTAREHAAWRQRWGAAVEVVGPHLPGHQPDMEFVEGFDLHSQLSALTQELASLPAPADASRLAVVLPDAGQLPPLLHHLASLPETPLNISMGYPLARSALAQLLDAVLTLHENAPGDGRVYWKDLLALIRHPYLKMLEVDPGAEGVPGQHLRPLFHHWETSLRRGGSLVDPREWQPEAVEDPAAERLQAAANGLRHEILDACLAFATPARLTELAAAIRRLGHLLRRHGQRLWQRHLLDAEGLHRLLANVVAELEGCLLAGAPLPRGTLFAILRDVLAAERVSFEPEPLEGIQVLGFLESRLLTFERLFLLGITEERLPGPPPADPLLPDALRPALGLPDSRQGENVTAYNFHRLVRSARRVTILYQAGVTAGIFDGKSMRSRLVEELVWQEEQRQGRLLHPGDAPLRLVHLPVRAIPPQSTRLPRTPAMAARLAAYLAERPLSATALDTYIQCPARFAQTYLFQVREPEEVLESGDPAALGQVVHQLLHKVFAPWQGREVVAAQLAAAGILDDFTARLRETGFYQQMTGEKRIALEMVGRERLRRYLAQAPATRILDLEKTLRVEKVVDSRPVALVGQIDRLDARPEGVVVVDYKTGGVRVPPSGLWREAALFERMAAWRPGQDDSLLAEVAEAVPSLQLPLYLHLVDQTADFPPPANGALVELAKDGKEHLLFDPGLSLERRQEILGHEIPTLVDFVLRHLLAAPSLDPTPSRQCGWCSYRATCGGQG